MKAVQIEQKSYEMHPREGLSVAHFLTVADIHRSQEAWRARLALDDPGHEALPAGPRSVAENRDV
jgi:hypothetical protein